MGNKLINVLLAIVALVAIGMVVMLGMRSQSVGSTTQAAASEETAAQQAAVATATAPATRPRAPVANDPRAVATAYLKAMMATDLPATLELVEIPDHLREIIEGTIAGEYAHIRAEIALDSAFPDGRSWHQPWLAELDDQLKLIPKAQVIIKDNAATLVSGKHPTLHFSRVKGDWKIDYLKTEQIDLEGATMDLIHEEPKLYDELVGELKAGKFASRQEYHGEELRRRQSIGR
jgi:hypothetical protein